MQRIYDVFRNDLCKKYAISQFSHHDDIHIFNNRRNVIICNHNSESQQYKKHSDSQMVFFRSEKCPDPHFRFFNINQHFRRSSIRESKKDIHLDTAGKSLLTL